MAGKWIMGYNARQATKYVDADGKSTLAPTAKGRLLAGQPLVQPLTMNKIWGVGSEEDKQRRFSIMGAAKRYVLPELMGGQKPWMQGIGLEQRGSYDAKLRTPGYSTDMAHVHNLAERGIRKVLTKQVSLAAPPPGATPAQMTKWRSMQSSMGKVAMQEEIKCFKDDKGVGFIVSKEAGNDVFFNISNCVEGYKPQEGDKITFDLGQGRDGRTAAANIAPMDA